MPLFLPTPMISCALMLGFIGGSFYVFINFLCVLSEYKIIKMIVYTLLSYGPIGDTSIQRGGEDSIVLLDLEVSY